MQLQPNQGFVGKMNGFLSGKDYYNAPNGAVVSVKKGTGKVEFTEKGVLKVTDADKVVISGSKGDDKIHVINSFVKFIAPGKGDNKTLLDKCTFKKFNKLWGTGSRIITGGGLFTSYKKGSDMIQINGDFDAAIYAQQGAGTAWGGDKKAHKDQILINGNHNGYITVDSQDKVAVKGKKDGKIVNITEIVL